MNVTKEEQKLKSKTKSKEQKQRKERVVFPYMRLGLDDP